MSAKAFSAEVVAGSAFVKTSADQVSRFSPAEALSGGGSAQKTRQLKKSRALLRFEEIEKYSIVYKLFRQSEWQDAARTGLFTGSPDDRRDGFIHLSAASQVRGTFEKYFASEREPVLAGFDAESLGVALKWEISRNGERFPHLYGVLDVSRALSVSHISRDGEGVPAFPAEIPFD